MLADVQAEFFSSHLVLTLPFYFCVDFWNHAKTSNIYVHYQCCICNETLNKFELRSKYCLNPPPILRDILYINQITTSIPLKGLIGILNIIGQLCLCNIHNMQRTKYTCSTVLLISDMTRHK